MSTHPPFGTQLVGQTENAFGAILDRELTGTRLSRAHWIALTVTVTSGGALDRDALAGRLARALKLTPAEADERLDGLASTGLIARATAPGSPVIATDAGVRLHARIHAAVAEVTERLWGDLPPEDVATAGKVLATVLERANRALEQDRR